MNREYNESEANKQIAIGFQRGLGFWLSSVFMGMLVGVIYILLVITGIIAG